MMKTLIHYLKQKPLFAVLLLTVLSIVAGCGMDSEYPGFSRSVSGIHYRLIVTGEGERMAVPGDIITADITYRTTDDSVFFNARREFRLDSPSYNGSVEECFAMLARGDEAEFIIDAANFFMKTLDTVMPGFLRIGDNIIVSVKMLDIRRENEFSGSGYRYPEMNEVMPLNEQRALHDFAASMMNGAAPDENGIYFLQLSPGSGKAVKAGDIVELNYEGRFLDGDIFDSTYERNETFRFVFGNEYQLIKGLEIIVGRMREGERARVLIPSLFAYGQHGSSTGLVPPYTPMVYEVEIVSVK
ncbi:MAG: hypothetical protein EA408_07345 [Marinilabiliales bacterium]|nr:MAG: hypothetical protein EA408_07345 [Marinilabiliales bacterium]